MEDLNKNQLVLLVLLISFVTSIGTGIITVSLLMQAPLEVTRTINHVIEKTIETVTPALITTNTNTTKPQMVTTTIIVREDDQVVNAIAKNTKSIVRIHEKSESLGVDNVYALGVVVSASGTIATDKKAVSEAMSYTAVMSDGTVMPLIAIAGDRKSDIGFFQVKLSASSSATTFFPVSFSSTMTQLGQSVIIIGGETNNTVSVGRITSINTKDSTKDTATSTPSQITSFSSDAVPSTPVSGAPVFSLAGEFIGMSLSSFSSSKSYIPSAVVKREVMLLLAPKSSV